MIVSNTEITEFNTCEMKHFYRFRLGIEPKLASPAIVRGVVGHSILDQYYQTLQATGNHSDAIDAGLAKQKQEMAKILTKFPEEFELADILTDLKRLFLLYTSFYKDEPYEVVQTETKHVTPIAEGIDYALRLDLLVKFTRGEYRGDLAIVDHKFLYNFKTPAELNMDVQLPKYISTLKRNGHVVSKGYFNQIRYRKIKDSTPDQLLSRAKLVNDSQPKVDNVWKECIKTATKIKEVNELPIEQHHEKISRNLNTMVCKFCNFQRVCQAELREESTDTIIKVDYQNNTYGYGSDVSDYID